MELKLNNEIKALLITPILYVIYPLLRDLGVFILHLFNMGVVIYSYYAPDSALLEIFIISAILIFAMVYVYLRGGRLRNGFALVFFLMPVLTIGHIFFLVLFAALALSMKYQLKEVSDVLVAFVFFQWIFTTIAVEMPHQSYTYVPEGADKIFVFAHGGWDAYILDGGNSVLLSEVVEKNGWEDKCFYMYACNGDRVCRNYNHCTYFHEVDGTYIPMFTFFPDIFQGIFAACP